MYFVNIHTHCSLLGDDAIGIYNYSPEEILPNSLFSVGIHPWFADKFNIQQVEQIIENNPINCLAIGECGIDLLRSPIDQFEQEEIFRAQLQLAGQCHLPVILHLVRATHIFGRIIQDFPELVFIWHGFKGKFDVVKQFKNHNVFFSFNQSAKNEFVWQNINAEKIFCETDNSDGSIASVYKSLALIRNVDVNTLKNQLFKNAVKVFGNGLER